MKNLIKVLGIVFLIAIIALSMIVCSPSPGETPGPTPGPTPPTEPEVPSGKTAMQFFMDEGITIGINAGNSLDAVDNYSTPGNPLAIETAWGNPNLNQAYFNGLANLGFKIVRIPVTWNGHIGPAPNYTIEAAYLQRVAQVVNMAHTAGLICFINIHHDGHLGLGGWLSIPQLLAGGNNANAIYAKYEAVWKQIAEYFINYGDWLMFQGFNEIHDGEWGTGTPQEYTIINTLNKKFTDVVRATGGNNSHRYLLYYGYNTNYTVGTNTNFILPADIPANGTTKQIVGFHYYYPYDFSLLTTTHTWDTASNRNHVNDAFGNIKNRFINNGIPVIIGECGPARYANYPNNNGCNAANVAAARQNRLLFIDFLYGKARENGFVPIYWENGSYNLEYAEEGDFSLINRTTGQPNSTESRTVIERMIAAINNTTPPAPGGGGDPVIGVWEWATFNDSSNGGTSTVNMTEAAGAYTFTGNVTNAYEYGFAGWSATPDTATLTALRTATSISFKVMGDGKTYKIMLPTSNITDYSYYSATFSTTNGVETTVTINISGFSQPIWGSPQVALNKSLISNIQWQTNDGALGSFNITIRDLVLN